MGDNKLVKLIGIEFKINGNLSKILKLPDAPVKNILKGNCPNQNGGWIVNGNGIKYKPCATAWSEEEGFLGKDISNCTFAYNTSGDVACSLPNYIKNKRLKNQLKIIYESGKRYDYNGLVVKHLKNRVENLIFKAKEVKENKKNERYLK